MAGTHMSQTSGGNAVPKPRKAGERRNPAANRLTYFFHNLLFALQRLLKLNISSYPPVDPIDFVLYIESWHKMYQNHIKKVKMQQILRTCLKQGYVYKQLRLFHQLYFKLQSKLQISMARVSEKFEYIIKLVILGDTAVGKTNLLLRFTDEAYKPTHLPTIGVDFKVKVMNINGKRVKCQLWDTAGQERFRTITETYYKGASGIVLVYSVGDRKSFNNIGNWMSQIAQRQEEDVPKVIVGNKCDLRSGDRCVSYDEGKELALRYGAVFIESSAKDGLNVQTIFDSLGHQVMDKIQKDYESQETTMEKTNAKLNLHPQLLKSKLSCCENA